ncbi:MAG: HTTM domain-containing protein [Myxococcota bacterium]
MTRAWTWWVDRVDRLEDATPLLWVRVLVPLAIVGDLLAMAWHSALRAVLLPRELGGIGGTPAPWSLLDGWAWAGPALWATCLVAMPLVSAGIATRPALIVGVIAHAQLGHLFVPGDRGIDRLLRTVLLILLFSDVTARQRPARIRAWAGDLLRWLLVVVYLAAGLAKVEVLSSWLDPELPELFTILCDPLAGRLDPAFWWPVRSAFVIGGAGTLVFELGAPVLLTRWGPWWALFGAAMHLGIALSMDLGMFSWGMLATYPVLMARWIPRWRGSTVPG